MELRAVKGADGPDFVTVKHTKKNARARQCVIAFDFWHVNTWVIPISMLVFVCNLHKRKMVGVRFMVWTLQDTYTSRTDKPCLI